MNQLEAEQARADAVLLAEALETVAVMVAAALAIVDGEIAEPWDMYTERLARRVRAALTAAADRPALAERNAVNAEPANTLVNDELPPTPWRTSDAFVYDDEGGFVAQCADFPTAEFVVEASRHVRDLYTDLLAEETP